MRVDNYRITIYDRIYRIRQEAMDGKILGPRGAVAAILVLKLYLLIFVMDFTVGLYRLPYNFYLVQYFDTCMDGIQKSLY